MPLCSPGLPRLPGALCIEVRGRFHEAENGNRPRVIECIAICRRCPALGPCREWAAGQRELVGVVAGTLHGTVRRDDETLGETKG